MKVLIKEFNVDMELKNKGIELDIKRPDGRHLGDLVLTKTKVIWCTGQTLPENGKKLSWDKFIKMMDEV